MKAPARVLMVQGTASSAGKSLLVTGLCRLLRRDGFDVAPFKAQNMSNNSSVTPDGGEIGRAQAVQAEAAFLPSSVDMNPVLLKPEADHRSQAVVLGRPAFTMYARSFLERKAELWPVVTGALDRLRAEHDIVVVEGAGSPAEINLKSGDIVNMAVARFAAAPVLLVGDIDRGGVFAHLYGTLALLEQDERSLVRGLVVNKFRGAVELLEPGLRQIEQLTGCPVAGVVPFIPDLGIADEDAVALDEQRGSGSGLIDVVVVWLPHISNFDDFDAFRQDRNVRLRFVARVEDIGRPDLIILPGTKATQDDLAWLWAGGIAGAVQREAEHCAVIGICGGYQMLGFEVHDPAGVESSRATQAGLGLLPVRTVFEPEKATHRVEATVTDATGLLEGLEAERLAGYEIHMGRTERLAGHAAPFTILSRSGRACAEPDGSASSNGRVLGTYLHGLFDNGRLYAALLRVLAGNRSAGFVESGRRTRDEEYDRLADVLRAHLDMDLIYGLLEIERPRG